MYHENIQSKTASPHSRVGHVGQNCVSRPRVEKPAKNGEEYYYPTKRKRHEQHGDHQWETEDHCAARNQKVRPGYSRAKFVADDAANQRRAQSGAKCYDAEYQSCVQSEQTLYVALFL